MADGGMEKPLTVKEFAEVAIRGAKPRAPPPLQAGWPRQRTRPGRGAMTH